MASIERSRVGKPDKPPLVRRVAAGLIVLAAVGVGLYLLIHVIETILLFVLAAVVVAAVVWALKTLVW